MNSRPVSSRCIVLSVCLLLFPFSMCSITIVMQRQCSLYQYNSIFDLLPHASRLKGQGFASVGPRGLQIWDE
ncbi:hypothetical protein BKA70DRAFT_855419 [Coprinopsis sp. MPI-PUGE-AT-0042]|nr:hypothetical protein BKA70DRAFT_288775 [Coprinopsis sp. MPI-PUGE-AT-0042]KAH6911416.1 hypothetical protein BKA70DRAFT_855419 [Coprinopsis sp. MPI-PUGE-AT-0042]